VVILHSSSLYCSFSFCLLQNFIHLHPSCPTVMTLFLPPLSLACSMLYRCRSGSLHLNHPFATFNHPLSSFFLVYFNSAPSLFALPSMYVHSTFALFSTLSNKLLSLILLKLAPSMFSLSPKPGSLLLPHLPNSAMPPLRAFSSSAIHVSLLPLMHM
jgi:hypothetical protein